MANEPPGALPERLLSERLLLRPYQAADAPAVWQAMRESHDHLQPWMPWTDDYHDEDEVRDYLLRARAVWEQQVDLPLGIFRRADGRFLGGTGLHRVDWDERRFEIGYWLRIGALRQGYARETVALLTRLAFQRLEARRVEVRVHPDNWRSRRVPEALGFTLRAQEAADEQPPPAEREE
ncbi:MAG: GNAT family N-acetyltransferase, partial [Chloroflexota bacterium]